MHDEQALIASFVIRSKRKRYREMLEAPRTRGKFTSLLAHFRDFEAKYRLPLESNRLFAENVAVELLKRRSPTIVRAISENPALDGRDWPLTIVLPQIVGAGMGTVLSCIPACLAFVETEDERFILERHNPLDQPEYIRFVIGRKDDESHVEQGVFQASALALEWGQITGSDADELYAVKGCFNQNLERPTSFGRDTLRLGICWFKTGSKEHIAKMWEMVRILERNGIFVKQIRTNNPGYVIYEDEWQLVAEPFRNGTLRR